MSAIYASDLPSLTIVLGLHFTGPWGGAVRSTSDKVVSLVLGITLEWGN